jgi:D-alanine-D-alanine ligase
MELNMNIVVLAGGLSPERDVSLSSGSLIANALKSRGHRVLLLDAYEGIDINTNNNCDLFIDINSNKTYNFIVSDEEPDLEEIKRKNNNGNALIGKNVIKICEYADVVFIALHGAMGENEQLQATFDTLGIKYTGTGYIGSLLAMDKDLTKKLLVQSNIPTAEWVLFNTKNDKFDVILNNVGFPCVVKPCSCGSSVGVSIVNNIDELETALSTAKKYEENILVEKMIKGKEFSVGVLNEKALPPIEIITLTGFYDYKNKYQVGLTKEICPAELADNDVKKISELTLKIHKILRLGDYSRIDFILNENGEFICLEANTLPGMTPTSLIPQEAAAAGIKYEDLCEQIALFAMKNK